MTFEEWWKNLNKDCPIIMVEEEMAQLAWEAGYVVGINDVPIAEYEPPEGYVLVPVEPTEAMIDAWWDTHVDGETLDEVKAYKAMIQAAQEEE